eukprot:478519-Hanusia_phi.AAC.3
MHFLLDPDRRRCLAGSGHSPPPPAIRTFPSSLLDSSRGAGHTCSLASALVARHDLMLLLLPVATTSSLPPCL